MKIIISVITTLLLLLFIFMIIYLFPDRKKIEKFANKEINAYSNTIEETIKDSLLPSNPYAKILLNEYEVIQTYKYILKRSPTIPEINKSIYYSINELKEFLYNTPEYEKLIKIQDNIYNNGMEAAIAKKNLINRIMELYKKIYNTDIPVKMILPLRDCFIYLQLNIYLFIVMLENSNYSIFEDSVLSSYVLTKKILLELFNKYFNVLELKIHAEEKINKLSTLKDVKNDTYLTSKIEIANIIKDLIVINNDYLLVKIKSNYPNVFYEILKNTIGIDQLTSNNDDINNLKKFLNDLYNSSSKIIPSKLPDIKENYKNNGGYKIKEGYDNTNKTIYDYYAIYKKNKDNMTDVNDKDYYNDYYTYEFYNYLRDTDYSNKIIFTYYDDYKRSKGNIDINNSNYYDDLYTNEFDKYVNDINANSSSSSYDNIPNLNVRINGISIPSSEITQVSPEDIINRSRSANSDLPFRNNYMNDIIYDKDNRSVLRLYNPIVHNKSYLLPSGYRPPVCTSLGQEQLTQPVFTESKLLFQGLDIDKAFTETQVGSIMPKFIYNEFKDIRIK